MANIVYMARSAWTGLLDTIRSKASVSGTMTVSQATTAVENIPTGGGGDESFNLLVDRTISEANNSTVTTIGNYAFCTCTNLTTASFPNALTISISAFGSCSKLTTALFPNASSIANYAFYGCSRLATISFPNASFIGMSAFTSCSSLTTISFPNASQIGTSAFANCRNITIASFPNAKTIEAYAFYYCFKLETVSLPNASSIAGSAFAKCYNLFSFYLMGSSVTRMANANIFSSTPISDYTASTGGLYGSIFVPASLYNSYLTATNWSLYSSRIVSVAE